MELYYFSATGNTLSTARMLADELGGCKLIPIASLSKTGTIHVTDDAVGFLYPIYYGDMPYIIRSTVSRMEFDGEPYIFGVCTYRGYMGPSGLRLHDLLSKRGQKLSLYQGLSMPGNSRESTAEHVRESLAAQPGNVKAIADRIRRRESEEYTGELPEPSPVGNGAVNFRGMTADETCIGCGTCVSVCPMDNIRLVNSHAEIGPNCLTCFACFHWCPAEAIYMSKSDVGQRRPKYHHPDVTLSDIIAEKQQ